MGTLFLMFFITFRNKNMLADYYSKEAKNPIQTSQGGSEISVDLKEKGASYPKVLDSSMICNIRFKWYMYNTMLLLMVLNQITHEVFDPPISERAKGDKELEERIKISSPFFLGISLMVTGLALILTGVSIILSSLHLIIHVVAIGVSVYYSEDMDSLFYDYCYTAVILVFWWFSTFYYQFRSNKLAYMSTRKVLRLLEEQRGIFNHLPDGAMIHTTDKDLSRNQMNSPEKRRNQNQIITKHTSVKTLNKTFKEMLGSSENLDNVSGLDNLFKMQSNLSNAKMMSTGKLEEDHLSIIKWNDALLENRYLQKTSYQIKSGMLTQKEDYVIEAPQDIESSIQNFETGQVYEVLYKD